MQIGNLIVACLANLLIAFGGMSCWNSFASKKGLPGVTYAEALCLLFVIGCFWTPYLVYKMVYEEGRNHGRM